MLKAGQPGSIYHRLSQRPTSYEKNDNAGTLIYRKEPLICAVQTSAYPHELAAFGTIANIGNLIAVATNSTMKITAGKIETEKKFPGVLCGEGCFSNSRVKSRFLPLIFGTLESLVRIMDGVDSVPKLA